MIQTHKTASLLETNQTLNLGNHAASMHSSMWWNMYWHCTPGVHTKENYITTLANAGICTLVDDVNPGFSPKKQHHGIDSNRFPCVLRCSVFLEKMQTFAPTIQAKQWFIHFHQTSFPMSLGKMAKTTGFRHDTNSTQFTKKHSIDCNGVARGSTIEAETRQRWSMSGIYLPTFTMKY